MTDPITVSKFWKFPNNLRSHQYNKKRNDNDNENQTLPLNQLCNLNLHIKTKSTKIWVYKIEYVPNISESLSVIKALQLDKPIELTSLNSVSQNLVLKTLKKTKFENLGKL